MAKRSLLLGILVLAFGIGACVSSGSNVDSALLGTWVRTTIDSLWGLEEITFEKRNWQNSFDGINNAKGTYTIEGNELTRKRTHYYVPERKSWSNLSDIEAFGKRQGWTAQEITERFSPTYIYSISNDGNMLTLTEKDGNIFTYTRK